MVVLTHPILYFDKLPIEQAYHVLNKEIVPICKKHGLKLSIYSTRQALNRVKNHKHSDKLCSIEKTQKLFSILEQGISDCIHQSIGLYSLRQIIKEKKGESVTNGECIAAMLTKGYIADFAVERGKSNINCQFYIKLPKK